MPLATDKTGRLKPIDCQITIPGVTDPLKPFILPDISESRGVNWVDEPVIGRSYPIKTFGHGENRSFSMKWNVVIMDTASRDEAVRQINAFRSATYPVDGNGQVPYYPPSICKIKCGIMTMTGKDTEVCVVLKNMGLSFPTDGTAWDETYLMPYRFSIDLNWDVVTSADNLPGRDKIIG